MLIAGNLKSYLTSQDDVFTLAKQASKLARLGKHEVLLAPSFVHAGMLANKKHDFLLGAQDVSVAGPGAHTGDISAEVLKDAGVEYVIVGHSERRALGESNDIVAGKAVRTLEQGLKVILAFGESVRDEDGMYLSYIQEQILSVLTRVERRYQSHIILAYEPIWAIGEKATGVITPHDLEEMALFIRKIITETFDASLAKKIKVLYGGSVNADNAKELQVRGVDGFLLGRASSTPESLEALYKVL